MNTYFCNIDNFGDKLNQTILDRVFNTKITYSEVDNAEAIGIGSILDKVLARHFNFFKPKNKLLVLSSGFGFSEEYYLKKFKYAKPLRFKRHLNVLALRGKLTKSLVERIMGVELNGVVLGDGGLLTGRLIDTNIIEKIYDVGIVPHYADSENPAIKNLNSKLDNSIILDTTQNPMDFLNDLAKCKTIVSTAMHPLIAADALNIPNLWIRVSDVTTSLFKFKDYYSVYDIDMNPLRPDEFDVISKEFIEHNYRVPYIKVREIQDSLYDTFYNYLK